MSPRYTWDGPDDEVRVMDFMNKLKARLPSNYAAEAQMFVVMDPHNRWTKADNYVPFALHHIDRRRAQWFREHGYSVAHPDVTIVGYPGMAPFTHLTAVIELDGSIHDTRPGHKKTLLRNKKYREGGVHCITVNEADCKMLGVEQIDFAWNALHSLLLDPDTNEIVEKDSWIC